MKCSRYLKPPWTSLRPGRGARCKISFINHRNLQATKSCISKNARAIYACTITMSNSSMKVCLTMKSVHLDQRHTFPVLPRISTMGVGENGVEQWLSTKANGKHEVWACYDCVCSLDGFGVVNRSISIWHQRQARLP